MGRRGRACRGGPADVPGRRRPLQRTALQATGENTDRCRTGRVVGSDAGISGRAAEEGAGACRGRPTRAPGATAAMTAGLVSEEIGESGCHFLRLCRVELL